MDADSASWWQFVERKGLIKEASRQGWGEAIAQLQDWLIFNPVDLAQDMWGLMSNVSSEATRSQLALKLWIAATGEEPMAADTRTRESTLAQMDPCNALELAGAAAGRPEDASQMGKAL